MPNSPTPLQQLVQSANFDAVERARLQGPSAVRELADLVQHSDEDVRFLAVTCVAAAGGPDAPKVLLRAVLDSDEQTRATAARALMDHVPEGLEAQVLQAWNTQPDPTVRYYLALSLGLTRGATQQVWKRMLAALGAGDPPSTADSLIGALARQQDPDGKRALRTALQNASGPRAATVLEVFRYVNNASLLKYLEPLIGRTDVAVDLSSHDETLTRRTCDLAVDEVLRLAPGRLPFAPAPSRRYTPTEVAATARYLAALPEPN